MASSHLLHRKQINVAEQPGRNMWRTYWNDSPDVIKMLTIAIKEVKIKRDLEKEVARAGDLELLPTFEPVLPRVCKLALRDTFVQGRRKRTLSEVIRNCTNLSEVEINSQRICLIKNNKSASVFLLQFMGRIDGNRAGVVINAVSLYLKGW